MALKLAEGLVDQVKSYIYTNMGAKLTALQTEYGDGITLDNLAAIHIAEQALESVQSFPVAFVIAERSVMNEWRSDFSQESHDLLIGVLVKDQDTTTLRRKLYRYIRAIWELLIEAQYDAGITRAMLGEPEFLFSPIQTRPGSNFLAEGYLRVTMAIKEAK